MPQGLTTAQDVVEEIKSQLDSLLSESNDTLEDRIEDAKQEAVEDYVRDSDVYKTADAGYNAAWSAERKGEPVPFGLPSSWWQEVTDALTHTVDYSFGTLEFQGFDLPAPEADKVS